MLLTSAKSRESNTKKGLGEAREINLPWLMTAAKLVLPDCSNEKTDKCDRGTTEQLGMDHLEQNRGRPNCVSMGPKRIVPTFYRTGGKVNTPNEMDVFAIDKGLGTNPQGIAGKRRQLFRVSVDMTEF